MRSKHDGEQSIKLSLIFTSSFHTFEAFVENDKTYSLPFQRNLLDMITSKILLESFALIDLALVQKYSTYENVCWNIIFNCESFILLMKQKCLMQSLKQKCFVVFVRPLNMIVIFMMYIDYEILFLIDGHATVTNTFLLCFLFYCTKWYSPQLECVIFDAFSPALCGRAIARSSLWRNIRCFVAFLVEEVANYLLLWLRVSFHYIQKMEKTFINLSSMLKCFGEHKNLLQILDVFLDSCKQDIQYFAQLDQFCQLKLERTQLHKRQ